MSEADSQTDETPRQILLPNEWTDENSTDPVVFVNTGKVDLQEADDRFVKRTNEALAEAMRTVAHGAYTGQALLKVHVGEPRCITRMRPDFAHAAKDFARQSGASSIVAGDTTVAYTGRRGHRENPLGNAREYVKLAAENGWTATGPAGLTFIVLDRPSTALPAKYEFEDEEIRLDLAGVERFRDFYLAGGYAAADVLINYAHATFHGLAGLAGCVKGLAMGCSSLRGKLRMHQSLLPHFNEGECATCGKCVTSCPEDALELPEGAPCPIVDPDKCIGCGECEAVCAPGRNAVTLHDEDITDWQRGQETLPARMADYALGLMNDRWHNMVHVLHLYSITSRCDCLDLEQDPLIEHDLGFLVGANPFAVDAHAAQILRPFLSGEDDPDIHTGLHMAEQAANYAAQTYGIRTDAPLFTMTVR